MNMKKKMLSIMLAFAMVCVCIPGSNVEAASTKKQAGKAYAKIIQKYLDAYELRKEGNYDDIDESVNAEYTGGFYYETDIPVYRIYDYNGDGSLELFIGIKRESGTTTIYDVYTFRKGKAVQLMSGIGYRAGTCSLRKNGIIEDSWSGSAFEYGVTYHKLPKKKTKLSDVVSISYTYDMAGNATCKKTVKGKTTIITEAAAKKIEKKYSKKQKVTFYKLTDKAIKKVTKGKFTYSGQKHWKVTT